MFFSLTPKGKEKIQQMMQAELNMDSLFNQLKEYIQKGFIPFLTNYCLLTNMYNINKYKRI